MYYMIHITHYVSKILRNINRNSGYENIFGLGYFEGETAARSSLDTATRNGLIAVGRLVMFKQRGAQNALTEIRKNFSGLNIGEISACSVGTLNIYSPKSPLNFRQR